jgi:hypothetical protein
MHNYLMFKNKKNRNKNNKVKYKIERKNIKCNNK